MNGKQAKKLRRLVFALMVKEKIPATEYRINAKGEIRAFGARAAYQGMKRAFKERGGFVAQAPGVPSDRARAEWRRSLKREGKRYARQRRRTREREAREDLDERLRTPIPVPSL